MVTVVDKPVSDNLGGVEGFKVNGTKYRIDFNALKNVPFYYNKTEETLLDVTLNPTANLTGSH